MPNLREATKKWYREKEGFIALFCLVYWAGFTTYILYHFIRAGQIDVLLLDFYRSFSQLPLVVMGGVFGVKVAQDFGREREKVRTDYMDYNERV